MAYIRLQHHTPGSLANLSYNKNIGWTKWPRKNLDEVKLLVDVQDNLSANCKVLVKFVSSILVMMIVCLLHHSCMFSLRHNNRHKFQFFLPFLRLRRAITSCCLSPSTSANFRLISEYLSSMSFSSLSIILFLSFSCATSFNNSFVWPSLSE